MFLARRTARRGYGFAGVDNGLIGGYAGALVDAHVAVQRHDQVGDADGLDDGQDDGTPYLVTSSIIAMGFCWADVEIGDVASTRPEG